MKTPKPTAAQLIDQSVSPNFVRTFSVDLGDFSPNSGQSCSRTMMTPTPLMNPLMTGYGKYRTYRPTPSSPSPTWITPPARKDARTIPSPASMLPVAATA